ncbi:hypothetical protein GBA52_019790 [Prunus armeniaca]|nr:hypothetical protein GBA52_019790 [Prunus armeniaca]
MHHRKPPKLLRLLHKIVRRRDSLPKREHLVVLQNLDVKPALPKREKLQNQEDEQAKAFFKTEEDFCGRITTESDTRRIQELL